MTKRKKKVEVDRLFIFHVVSAVGGMMEEATDHERESWKMLAFLLVTQFQVEGFVYYSAVGRLHRGLDWGLSPFACVRLTFSGSESFLTHHTTSNHHKNQTTLPDLVCQCLQSNS